jgi:hypothetical protein
MKTNFHEKKNIIIIIMHGTHEKHFFLTIPL